MGRVRVQRKVNTCVGWGHYTRGNPRVRRASRACGGVWLVVIGHLSVGRHVHLYLVGPAAVQRRQPRASFPFERLPVRSRPLRRLQPRGLPQPLGLGLVPHALRLLPQPPLRLAYPLFERPLEGLLPSPLFLLLAQPCRLETLLLLRSPALLFAQAPRLRREEGVRGEG